MKSYICSVADCGKPGLGRCSQCKTRYCGEECQADDWPRHLRFCLPLPPLEFPQSDPPGQIIDINNSSTILAGEVSVEEIQSAQPVTITSQKAEQNNNSPASVEKPVAVQEVGEGSPSPKERKEPETVPDISPAQEFKEAVTSPQMKKQEVSPGLQVIDTIEIPQIVSPAEFTISLAAEVRLLLNICWPILSFLIEYPGSALRAAHPADERQTPRCGQLLDRG